MKLIEAYALGSGLKIGRPYIYDKYFSIPFEKYIVIHAGGAMPAKVYEYYGEVVSILRPILDKYDYEIIQIGARSDMPVPRTINFLGATTIHQTAYAIKNAKLILGNDSCNVHIASGYDIPIVALYGSTTPCNHGPSFSSPEKLRLMQADLKGKKPSYAREESPKLINTIKPEDVARNVLDLLGIKDEVTRETVYVGPKFNFQMVDLVPDCIIAPNFCKDYLISIRMDYKHDENALAHNLSMRQYRVICDKPINENLIKGLKQNIHSLIYDINEDSSTEFVEFILRNGVNFIMTSALEGKALADAKLKFFDYGMILQRQFEAKKELQQNQSIDANTKYKTNKFLLGRDKIYLNKTRWKQDKPVANFQENTDVVDLEDDDFFNAAESFYIYNE